MKTTKLNKITQGLSLAMFASSSLVSYHALAQETDAAEQDKPVEVIQVRGIRASQKAALNQKRFSNAVVDSISAEDIGKFPDKNIAESLQRLPGISISRNFAGEGGSVSIRGTNPELTLVNMNGNYVASTGWFSQNAMSRSFDMDLLPPEMVAGVDVYKSPMASLDEGGVGGIVEVRTRTPLKLDPHSLYLSAEVQRNSIGDGSGKGASGLYSWQNDEGNFGVLGALSTLEIIGRAHKAENYMDDGWAGAGIAEFHQDRKRDAIDLTMEYAPTDDLDMNLHLFRVELDAANTNQNYLIIAGTDVEAFNNNVTGATAFGPANGFALNGNFAGGPFDDTNSRAATDISTQVIAFNLNYQWDYYTLSTKIGQTKAEGGDGGNYNVGWTSGNPNQSIDFDMTGRDAMLLSPNNTDAGNHAEYNMGGVTIREGLREDKETFAQIDLTKDLDLGALASVQTGIKIRDHEFSSQSIDHTLRDGYNTGKTKADFADGHFDHSGIGLLGGSPNNVARVDGEALRAHLDGFKQGSAVDPRSFGVITEDIWAAYVQANFNGDNYRGNVGLRYVSTDSEAEYYDFFDNSKFQNESSDYADWLPSFNLALDLADNLILRVSAAKVMSRPNYTFMNPASTITDTTRQISRGTVDIDPYRASQADIALEWYFNEESLLSVALFNKDIKSFIVQGGKQSSFEQDGVTWFVSEPSQGLGGQIEGVEFQYQQQYNNLGWAANVTYSDGHGLVDQGGNIVKDDLPGLSKLAYNLTAYYEDDLIATRVTYTYRDDYIAESTGIGGNTFWDAHGFLDASFTWHATDNLDLTVEATNLLDESTTQRLAGAYDAMRLAAENGRNLYLKASFRM